MKIDVLTLFPAMFAGPLDESIIMRARKKGLLDLQIHDLRNWTHDRHRTVDDKPFGGGPGMLMKPEPLFEAVTRLLPGVLGDDESSHDESFSAGLLEYPQYTRPAEFRGMKVPDILVSGNHAEIEKWRREQSKTRTKEKRPDLLK